MKINQFLSHLPNVSKTSNGWTACCPAHDDQSPSLSIKEGEGGRILIKCHAGCSNESVVSSLNLSMSDLFQNSQDSVSLDTEVTAVHALRTARYRSKKPMQQTAFYPYEQDGVLVAGVFRFDLADGSDGKEYVPVHATPAGGAVGDPSDGWPLYNLAKVEFAPDQPLFIVEGEKAADALIALGVVAVTSAHGSNGWKKTDWQSLVGRDLIFMPDNDEPGRQYANAVAGHLLELGHDRPFRVIDLSELPEKADAVELLDALRTEGVSVEKLSEAVLDRAQPWQPDHTAVSESDLLMQKLAVQYGDPFVCGAKGQPTSVNQQFVAGYCANVSNICFDPAVDRFYEYESSSGLWLVRTDNLMIQRVSTWLGELLELQGASHLRPKCGQRILAAIVSLLKGVVERRDQWAVHKNLLHVANGMLLINGSGELLPFDKKYYSRNRSNFPWDVDADCSRFLAALLEPALSREDILLLQKYAGQCLLGNNPSQTLLLIRGTAGGGKSTLCEIIESVIGEQNVAQLRVEQLNTRFEIRRFIARTLLAGKDVPGDFLDSKGAHVIKALVGGDRLEVEVKGGNESFEVRGEFNVVITSNSRLQVKLDGDAGAWRRRLLIILFDQIPTEKRIPFFAQQLLEDEGAGILRWMVDGVLLLLKDLEQFGTIQLSEAQIRRVEDLISESDSIRSFVRDRVIAASSESNVTTAELIEAYFDYCDDRGWQAQPRRRFETAVADVMMELLRAPRRNDIQREGKNQRGYSKVALFCADKSPPEPSNPTHPKINPVEIV